MNSPKSDTIQKKSLSYENEHMSFDHLCNACLIRPKNGIFNHGKIAHIYCCYLCAKKIWHQTNRCPVCNRKIRYVTKMITI